jgi:hypothetical protein
MLRTNVSRESGLMTEEAHCYVAVGKEYASRGAIEHSQDEYGGRLLQHLQTRRD